MASDAVNSIDEQVAEWFVAQPTPTGDTVSVVGSYFAETVVKVVATAVLGIAMRLALKRAPLRRLAPADE